MVIFGGFSLLSVPGFISFSLLVLFNFSIALFLSQPVDLICSQAHV